MSKIVAYIGFAGHAAEAMNFYKECLGGELQILPIEGSPCEEYMPDMKDKVMHSALTKGDLQLYATDMSGPEGIKPGNNISLNLSCTDEEINGFFDKLSQGGTVGQPVGPAFWGGQFGYLTDRYGIQWMLTTATGN